MSREYRVYCITESSNIYERADVAPSTCPNDPLHIINPLSISVLDSGLSNNYIFGDGLDGSVVINTNTAITRDMYYENLTVTSGAILSSNGYRIFVSRVLTLADGWISANGGNASGNIAGGIPHAPKTLGGGTAGGAGGNPTAPGISGGSLSSSTRIGGLGGVGGGGLNGLTPTLGGAGGGGTAVPDSNGGTNIFKLVGQALRGRDLANVMLNGGSGGGGGGGGGSGNGGGGGGGGGVCLVVAKYIHFESGGITANGGNGGIPPVTTAGGGAGGGGGCVVVISSTGTDSFTIEANGGLGGLSGGTGSAGSAGAVGNTIRILI